jgi:hypothetical protein
MSNKGSMRLAKKYLEEYASMQKRIPKLNSVHTTIRLRQHEASVL